TPASPMRGFLLPELIGGFMKIIRVTLDIEVPDDATDKDIHDFVDVAYGECNSMKKDNPVVKNYDVTDHEWEYL
ncbi:hypothetical protein PSI22_21340, partial [Xenorhabdus sp. XENO-7]